MWITSRDDLKNEIRTQIQGDIVLSEFDVGFFSASGILISIRNPVDLADIWADIKKGNKVVLWCDGLKVKHRINDEVESLMGMRQMHKRRERIR